jgi:hypothetical protein
MNRMSLRPARYNFSIWKGATFRKQLTLLQPDSTPRDLTGYTGNLIIRLKPEDTPLLELTNANGGMSFQPGGIIILRVESTVTESLSWSSGIYDLLITGLDSITEVLLYGNFSVKGV